MLLMAAHAVRGAVEGSPLAAEVGFADVGAFDGTRSMAQQSLPVARGALDSELATLDDGSDRRRSLLRHMSMRERVVQKSAGGDAGPGCRPASRP